MRLKAIYIKNLKMSEGKIAAQVAHAVKNLGTTPKDCDIVVLGVSRKKFNELVNENENCYVQVDKGLTEVEEGTPTAAAWIESDQIIDNLIDNECYWVKYGKLFKWEIAKYNSINDSFTTMGGTTFKSDECEEIGRIILR